LKIFIYTIPVTILVTYSQLIVKWRTSNAFMTQIDGSIIDRLIWYFSDYYIISAYLAALLGSFFWLVVISRIPLSIGFPVYIGSTFLLVILGSWLFLGEGISITKILASSLILTGIVLGGLE
jgi:multidrug transporter EmrE-like cation transporter